MKEDYTHITVILDRTGSMGFGTTALVGLQVDPAEVDNVAEKLTKLREVQYVAVTTGAYDIFVWIALPSPAEAEHLRLTPDAAVLRWRVDLVRGAHVRPDDVARAVLPSTQRPTGLVAARTGLWGLRHGRVFDLLAPADLRPLEEHLELARGSASLLRA